MALQDADLSVPVSRHRSVYRERCCPERRYELHLTIPAPGLLAGGGELVSGRLAIGPIIDHSQHIRLSSKLSGHFRLLKSVRTAIFPSARRGAMTISVPIR